MASSVFGMARGAYERRKTTTTRSPPDYNASRMNTSELQAKHVKYVLSPWVPQGGLAAPVIVRGEGSYIFDADGKKYLDLGSGLIATNLGHGHPKVVAAMQEQARTLCYAAPSLFNDKHPCAMCVILVRSLIRPLVTAWSAKKTCVHWRPLSTVAPSC